MKGHGLRRVRHARWVALVLVAVAAALPIPKASADLAVGPVPAPDHTVTLHVSAVDGLVDGQAVTFDVQTSGGATLIGNLTAHLCVHGSTSYGTTSFGYSGNNGSRCVYEAGIVSGALAGSDYEVISGPYSGAQTTSGTVTFRVGTGSVTWGNVSGFGPFTLQADSTHAVDLVVQVNLSGDSVPTTYFVQPLTFAAPGNPPGAPTAVHATTKNGSVALSWTAPAIPGDSPITGYVVTPSRVGLAQPPQTFTSSATTETIAGLTNGASYTFSVAAINAAGTGPASLASLPVLVGVPASPGSAAAQPAPTTTRTGPAIVTFTTPANNGSMISKFTARCTSKNGGVTRSTARAGAAAAPITVTGLTLGKSYTCTVSATNARGAGSASRASNAVVIGAPVSPRRPAVARIGRGRLRVTFAKLTAAQTNGAPLSAPAYTATCASGNGGVARSAAGTASPIVVPNLTADKTYTCSLRAHNARGYSSPSFPSAALPA